MMRPPHFIARLVLTGDAHATVDRLFVSRHVRDLRLIIAAAWIAVLVMLCLGPVVAVWTQTVVQWHDIENSKTGWIFVRIALTALANFIVFVAPALAVFGGILAWAYQIGSARLGVVDLFACEISTLCRIITVLDTVPRLVDKCDFGIPAASTGGAAAVTTDHFSSQENYFPVFDSSGRDLQTLEARVVVNITAFYTYMKAMRDGLRSLAAITSQPAGGPPNSLSADPRHEGTRNVIYMLYLALESARKSVHDLVEFKPELMERTAVILISELSAYTFLCSQFVDESDIRSHRIRLRGTDSRVLEPKLRDDVAAGRASEKTSAVPPSQESLVSE